MSIIVRLVPKLSRTRYAVEEAVLRGELKVAARARAAGTQNLPAESDQEPDETQQQIIDRCIDGLAGIKQHTQAQLATVLSRLQAQMLTPQDRDLNAAEEAARLAVAERRDAAREELVALRQAERRLWRELAEFRGNHGLTRSASYPASVWWAAGVTMVLALGESLINVRLFASADDFGLYGGWLRAVSFGTVNVAPLLLAGLLGLRYLAHVHAGKRLAGWLASALGFAWLGGFNLLVGHYRAALEGNPDQPIFDVVGRLMADPLHIGNMEGIMLLAVGVVVGALALLNGYCGFDDRYPGYGALDRRYRKALDAYTARKARHRGEVQRTVHQALAVIDRQLATVKSKTAAAVKLLGDAHDRLATFWGSSAQVAKICTRLLTLYREENKKVRTAPAPTYFAVFPQLATDPEGLPADLDERQRLLITGSEAFGQTAQEARTRLRELAEHELAATVGFVEDVEHAAAQRLAADQVDAAPATGLRLVKAD